MFVLRTIQQSIKLQGGNNKSVINNYKRYNCGIFVNSTPLTYHTLINNCKKDFSKRSVKDPKTRTMATASKTNRLALEKSPYLLQHAHNPVDWYPWGAEAFEKAKLENKLIFLSVGYSTCHWCHVMERESFENEEIAAILNELFVSIKVDREERPDVDKLYMMYVQMSTGSGGWPMSVFLTPDSDPLFGGTYFPPEDQGRQMGFKTLLRLIAKQWKNESGNLHKEAKALTEKIKAAAKRKIPQTDSSSAAEKQLPAGEWAYMKCLASFSSAYQPKFGGFFGAPKFPQPCIFNFLFHMYDFLRRKGQQTDLERREQCLTMCLHTLKKMAYGGIHDHVCSGFARYSVDSKWHVPHFEKMLYDQAQLAVAYTDAYVLSKTDLYEETTRDILKYVTDELSHPQGGFYGAEDADSYPYEGANAKKEGAFCVWEESEFGTLLETEETIDPNDASTSDPTTPHVVNHFELFKHHYNVEPDGNVSSMFDHHNELTNKNILHCSTSYDETAEKFKISVDKVKSILSSCHSILRVERRKRPRPSVDTKMITSWNGLMIAGFARAAFALNDQKYVERATRAALFAKEHLYNEEENVLKRCCYATEDGKGIAKSNTDILGFLDDYAFMIRGLIELYEATLDTSWLEWAEKLQERQDSEFWDKENHGYFHCLKIDYAFSSHDKEVLMKDDKIGAGKHPLTETEEQRKRRHLGHSSS